MYLKNCRMFIFLGFLALGLISQGCNYARMYDTEYVHTYEEASPEMPQGTVPVDGGIELLRAASPGELKNPLAYNDRAIEQGEWTYSNYCIQCHGPRGKGHGTVGQSFAPLPTDLSSPEVQRQKDGELFYRISLGYRRHPPLAGTVSEGDRWSVIVYLRSLVKKPEA
jgi:mono/diheme cytochrome c family protein